MSSELHRELEKQAVRIALLEEELTSTNQALQQQYEFSAGLEQDLENAILQLKHLVVTSQQQ